MVEEKRWGGFSREEAVYRVLSLFYGHVGVLPELELLEGESGGEEAWLGIALGGGVCWEFCLVGGELEWSLLLGDF